MLNTNLNDGICYIKWKMPIKCPATFAFAVNDPKGCETAEVLLEWLHEKSIAYTISGALYQG